MPSFPVWHSRVTWGGGELTGWMPIVDAKSRSGIQCSQSRSLFRSQELMQSMPRVDVLDLILKHSFLPELDIDRQALYHEVFPVGPRT